MQKNGLNDTELQTNIRPFLEEDKSFLDGSIIGSMCSMPDKTAIDWFSKYLEKNAGDPGLLPGTIKLEKEVIKQTASILNGKNATGYIVSGGTEANILAIWTAKKIAKEEKNELIVPCSTHFSFDKVADLMGLKLIKIPLDKKHRVIPSLIEKAITKKTLAIVGIAGTTGLGAIDPIEKLSKIAIKHSIYLHVDAAFGGFVIPFLKQLGRKTSLFDFSLEGVSSITIDPHKMGRSVIPGGMILYKNQQIAQTIQINAPYLSGGETHQSTITGTKPGAAIVATWAVMNKLGLDGYKKIIDEAMEKTNYFYTMIQDIKTIKTVVKPEMNVLGIKSTKMTPKELGTKLRNKGWAVSVFPEYLRIVIMPHVNINMINAVIKDLVTISKENA